MQIEFEEYPEPGTQIGFGQGAVEADAEHRDETSLPHAIADNRARFHLFHNGSIVVRKDEKPAASFSAAEISDLGGDFDQAVLLGRDGDIPVLATNVGAECNPPADPYQLYDMRALLYSTAVSDREASSAARARSLLHWHSMNRYCGRCGAPTKSRIGGYRRDCERCEASLFPRTDPVVIMLAVRDNSCLLGRGPHFPPGWYSTLAGFVEPGETIEEAVRRETLEESGIVIRRVRYHASQPWPFPHSLMIGAYGEAVSETIDFDADELEDCRWFDRDELRRMIEDRHPDGFKCPPTKAIAHCLIRHWIAG